MSRIINYKKLVRDKIPEIIAKDGHKAKVRTLDSSEFVIYLKAKLLEESKELDDSDSQEESYKELADLYEVLAALKRELKIDDDQLDIVQAQRRHSRGGFEKKIFLEEVEENDG